jgi:hypothetical protein
LRGECRRSRGSGLLSGCDTPRMGLLCCGDLAIPRGKLTVVGGPTLGKEPFQRGGLTLQLTLPGGERDEPRIGFALR